MKAVILAGGLGARLSEETVVRPKPMVEIGGKPILWQIMKLYSAHGVNDFIICCGYKGYLIKEYFANYFLHRSDVTFNLQSLGSEVTGYALAPPTHPSLFDVARVGEGMRSIIADIRDLPTLQSALREAQPEMVFHLAAQPLVRYSYQNPVETYATNVMGAVHLLEAVRHTPSVRAEVNVTSDKCYENREWVWGYREHEPMGGYDPYSNSKGCAELITAAYRNSFFTPHPSPLTPQLSTLNPQPSTLNPQPRSRPPAPAT